MRLGKRGFEARVKGDLRLEFDSGERLTSYVGLELLSRFVRRIGLRSLLREAECRLGVGGDFRFARVVMLVVAMLVCGARRLRHVGFLRDDPLVLRFSGLSRVPSERSLSRALQKLTSRTWPELDNISRACVARAVRPLKLRRITLDLDGTVVTTGLQVERAERGFNPHHRKNPSYYPLLATIAQTGHVVAHLNRRGNVHDSHRSVEVLREAVRFVRDSLGNTRTVEVRVDSAFFQRDFLQVCDRLGVKYAVKVPMWPWLNLKAVVKQKGADDWQAVDRAAGVEGVFAWLYIAPWKRAERIAIYRKKINHEPVKGRQLELFNPDDGFWEYSVVATNKSVSLRALWHFHNGRGGQEKILSELKSGYAFDAIPTQRYSANTTWQKLNVLSHNLVTSFQLATTATPKPKSLKRTTAFLFQTISTIRFEWLGRAARLLRPAGTASLRLADNERVRERITRIEQKLAQAA